MTRTEAIDLLDNLIGMIEDNHESDYDTALDMAIKALEYDDAKYHEEHGEVVVDKAVWEDAKRALEQEPSGDLISRQAVLDMWRQEICYGRTCHARDEGRCTETFCDFKLFEYKINHMPSVKPQEPAYCDRNICIKNEYNNIGCDECEVTKSQESCEDAISRQDAYKCLEIHGDYDTLNEVYERLEKLPPVKPQEKTGHWIKQERWDENIDGLNMWGNWRKCSECSHRIQYFDHHNYCPNCGAKMD